MKKIILATVILVAISITSFAGEKDVDLKLLNDLATTLKSSTQIHWTNKEEFTKATFRFNEKTAFAFYDANENELIGFAVQFNKEDLPGIVSDAIENKYGDWKLMDALVFIDSKGYIDYYAQVQKNNKTLALKITPGGDVRIYAKMFPGK